MLEVAAERHQLGLRHIVFVKKGGNIVFGSAFMGMYMVKELERKGEEKGTIRL